MNEIEKIFCEIENLGIKHKRLFFLSLLANLTIVGRNHYSDRKSEGDKPFSAMIALNEIQNKVIAQLLTISMQAETPAYPSAALVALIFQWADRAKIGHEIAWAIRIANEQMASS